MPKIIYIEPNGTRREVSAPVGMSVMEAALSNEIEGIVALCGGACACATCHVYVEADWYPKLLAPEEMEEGMLEAAWEPRANSRLSCQIPITAELDGLTVRIPAKQGG
jgi:ferredoxin, 2Fe-2S